MTLTEACAESPMLAHLMERVKVVSADWSCDKDILYGWLRSAYEAGRRSRKQAQVQLNSPCQQNGIKLTTE